MNMKQNTEPETAHPSPAAPDEAERAAGRLPERIYWRSFDELANTPGFRQWVESEFPEGATDSPDPVSRRHFMKIMSASFLLAGMGLAESGCRRPVEKIYPFSQMPMDYVHGVPKYYATAMPAHGSAIPLVATWNEGRPTKIEGNAKHPDSNGGTNAYAQASVLSLYDPDRAVEFKQGGDPRTRAATFDFLTALSRRAAANGGQGLSFLLEPSNSPSRARLQKAIGAKFPHARWYVYDPLDLDIHTRAASQAFGRPVKPFWRFDAAKVIVSLDCDFLGSEEEAYNHTRRFVEQRHLETSSGSINRLYAVESLMTLTGMNADHRLRTPGSTVVQVAGAIAAEVLRLSGQPTVPGLERLGTPPGVNPDWMVQCAADLVRNRGQSLVVAGYRQPLAVHLLAHAMNVALGNVGKTIELREAPPAEGEGIVELAKSLNAGQVETLVVFGGNPIYNAPADLNWSQTQRKAKTVVRLGYYEDETFPHCDWHLPEAHYLESWGDARTSDGTLVGVQPLIAPLFGGITELEVLARIGGLNATDPYAIVRETFFGFISGPDPEGGGVSPAPFSATSPSVPAEKVRTDPAPAPRYDLVNRRDPEETWRKFLHDGFLGNTAAEPVEVKLNPGVVAQALTGVRVMSATASSLEVVFYRDYKVDDGCYANNGWLQELPDPVTKMTWDNAVLISRKTAAELGVQDKDLVEITLGGRRVRGPIWVQPGFANYSLGLALGYGRPRSGRVGHKAGFDVYPLRTTAARYIAVGATLRKLGRSYPLSGTQGHWSMERRPIVREVNLDQYRQHPDFAQDMRELDIPGAQSLYPNPFEQLKKQGLHQWAMSIDLNKCTGCSACVIACQSENNIPIVGKEQVGRSREMQWLRLDRYYAGPETSLERFQRDDQQQFQTWIDDPQVVVQPMLCQMCEAAPCENVCPVNATSHSEEGLNVMTYNRCIGTRYCSNNCPYKVRRFNFFDYNKRPINDHKLYLGPLATRPKIEIDLMEMVKNPQVTVRMRGVMEKCTYCLQRIEAAKIAQKTKAGASGDVIVPADSFTTACAQACPAGAIVFGNEKDPKSRVSNLKKWDRNYAVLDSLLTKPRTTYLARVRNPNPAMPDYRAAPWTFENYEKRAGDPFERAKETEPASMSGVAGEKGAI
jgi:MoCo/4Fe-4S cofactor protein with predicted Tat translocation signal